jgi:hypothetical protein
VAFDPDVGHSLFDSAEERGSLVATEIEAAGLSQVLE